MEKEEEKSRPPGYGPEPNGVGGFSGNLAGELLGLLAVEKMYQLLRCSLHPLSLSLCFLSLKLLPLPPTFISGGEKRILSSPHPQKRWGLRVLGMVLILGHFDI